DAGGEATQVDFTNNCPFTVWPGTSIDDDGITQLPETGFILLPDQSTIIELAPTWSFARFWGRTECSYDATSNFTCLTGDCGTGKIQWSSQGCLPYSEFHSACMAFQKAQYCCEGYYSSLKRCPPSSYAKLFKAQCPDAYSYPFDNNMNSFCPTGKNYIITFCP
ncbi:Pathogenesis-related thaumatin-like protein 3.8, partial [Linum perenne]